MAADHDRDGQRDGRGGRHPEERPEPRVVGRARPRVAPSALPMNSAATEHETAVPRASGTTDVAHARSVECRNAQPAPSIVATSA
ncbi:hypothetical protein ACFV4F_06270 [Kitasatospora sp. NPDC059722]|uniref:hypothetical protein n=1 Tax=Kitasatospora sp. NPDC059722 TaxID=3346925 RepID=UPI0036BD160E